MVPFNRANPLGFLQMLRCLKTLVVAHPDRRACVLYFPQGMLWPSHKRPLDFKRGVELLAREISPCSVLPVAIHMDWGSSPDPCAWISVTGPIDPTQLTCAELEAKVGAELDSLQGFLAESGEQSLERAGDAGFVRLACGRSG